MAANEAGSIFREADTAEFSFEDNIEAYGIDLDELKNLQEEARNYGLIALASIGSTKEKENWTKYYGLKWKFISEYKRVRNLESEPLYPEKFFNNSSVYVENMPEKYEEIVENLEYVKSVLNSEGYRSFEIQYHPKGDNNDAHLQLKCKKSEFDALMNSVRQIVKENKWSFKKLDIKEVEKEIVKEVKEEVKIEKPMTFEERLATRFNTLKSKVTTLDSIMQNNINLVKSNERMEEIKLYNKRNNEKLEQMKIKLNKEISRTVNRNIPKISALDKAKSLLSHRK